ncbi:Lin0512 family protein [Antarctobacter sp.]|uniref:Lin0512 family protein n=1 Tax=Antarctobacter sp. TaxID=1872577 RepID=UPI002B26E042|nr:Lin0512 family protein [Antarctobacter sp.]
MTQRLIVQMGMGVGDTISDAATRAIADAQGRARIHIEAPFATRLTLGLPQEAKVDPSDLARAFGTSDVELHVVAGGMHLPQPGGGALFVVSAAIEVFPQTLPAQE